MAFQRCRCPWYAVRFLLPFGGPCFPAIVSPCLSPPSFQGCFPFTFPWCFLNFCHHFCHHAFFISNHLLFKEKVPFYRFLSMNQMNDHEPISPINYIRLMSRVLYRKKVQEGSFTTFRPIPNHKYPFSVLLFWKPLSINRAPKIL